MPHVCSCNEVYPSAISSDFQCCAFDTNWTQVLRCYTDRLSEENSSFCSYHIGQLRVHHRCPDCLLFVGFGRFVECPCPGKLMRARTHLSCYERRFPAAKPTCLHCGQEKQAKVNTPREDYDENVYSLVGRKGRTESLSRKLYLPVMRPLGVHGAPMVSRRLPCRVGRSGAIVKSCPCSSLNRDSDDDDAKVNLTKKERKKRRRENSKREVKAVVRDYLKQMVAALPYSVLCRDLSHGKAMHRIPVIVDNKCTTESTPLPDNFLYANQSLWYQLKTLPQHRNAPGCSCVDGCSRTSRCHCALKDGFRVNLEGQIENVEELIVKFHLPVCRVNCICRFSCESRFTPITSPALEIYWSSEFGWGVRTRTKIDKGTCIGEYVGEDMDLAAVNKLSNENRDKFLEYWKYTFNLGNIKCKVATYRGNFSRLINSSCSPNVTYFVRDEYGEQSDNITQGALVLFAVRNIEAGEPLTINYQKNFFDELKILCKCGAPNCYAKAIAVP